MTLARQTGREFPTENKLVLTVLTQEGRIEILFSQRPKGSLPRSEHTIMAPGYAL